MWRLASMFLRSRRAMCRRRVWRGIRTGTGWLLVVTAEDLKSSELLGARCEGRWGAGVWEGAAREIGLVDSGDVDFEKSGVVESRSCCGTVKVSSLSGHETNDSQNLVFVSLKSA